MPRARSSWSSSTGSASRPAGPGNAVTPGPHARPRRARRARARRTRIAASGLPVGLPDGPAGQQRGGPPEPRRRAPGAPDAGAHRRGDRRRLDRAASPRCRRPSTRGGASAPCTCVGLVGRRRRPRQPAPPDWRSSGSPREAGVERIVVHAFTDGRDTRPDSGLAAVAEIEAHRRPRGHGLRALLGDGPRPPLGPHPARLRRDRARRRRATAASGRRGGARSPTTPASRDEFIEPAVIGDAGRARACAPATP